MICDILVTMSKKNQNIDLPVELIKKDLIKNVLYMFFAIAVIVILKVTGFGFDWFSSVFHF